MHPSPEAVVLCSRSEQGENVIPPPSPLLRGPCKKAFFQALQLPTFSHLRGTRSEFRIQCDEENNVWQNPYILKAGRHITRGFGEKGC